MVKPFSGVSSVEALEQNPGAFQQGVKIWCDRASSIVGIRAIDSAIAGLVACVSDSVTH